MSSPFRNDRDAALERAARLEEENARLRAELDEARRPRRPRGKRAIALGACAFAVVGATFAMHALRPIVQARLEARRWARATEVVRVDWADEAAGTHHALHGAWSGIAGSYAVGDHGTILFRYPSGIWSRQTSDTTETLRAVDAGLTRNVVASFAAFAVGDHGTILRYDGDTRTWVREESGTTETLRAVAVVDWTAFAAGDHGTLLRRDEGGWTSVDTLTKVDLRALYAPEDLGASGHTLYVAGANGTILYLDNLFSGIVTAQHSGTNADLNAIAGERDTVVAGGAMGTVLVGSRDPTVPWATVDLGTSSDIVAVARARETFAWCAGDECRAKTWQPSIVALSRTGEIAALDARRGWIRQSAGEGAFVAMSSLTSFDRPNDELLLLGEDGRIRHGVPHP